MLYWFLITIVYDEGRITLQVAARNISEAIRQIIETERCPASAIIKAVKGRRIRRSD
jgi:hypothetical protein